MVHQVLMRNMKSQFVIYADQNSLLGLLEATQSLHFILWVLKVCYNNILLNQPDLFIGNNLIYLDPHVSQEYEYNHGKFSNSEEMRLLETYTPDKFKSTRIKSIDPSLTIGFYWNSRDEMEELLDYIDQAPTLEFGCSVIPVKASTPQYTEDNNIIEDFEMDDFL